jgi:hypothetical protein
MDPNVKRGPFAFVHPLYVPAIHDEPGWAAVVRINDDMLATI